MTHVLSAFLLSLSSNIDNFAVAIAYGVKKLQIGILSNFLIALVSALGTILSMSVGAVISRYLPNSAANFLGSGVLIAIGIWGIWDALEREKKRNREKLKRVRTQSMVAAGLSSSHFEDEAVSQQLMVNSATASVEDISYESFLENPEKADTDRSGYIDVKESIALAFGLTINNLGTGVGAGISGLSVGFTAVLTFLFSILAMTLGYTLGDRFTTRMTGISTGVISGLLIIGLGLYEYFVT